eukprot:4353640-Alexandrium_andersonii.AAC.1
MPRARWHPSPNNHVYKYSERCSAPNTCSMVGEPPHLRPQNTPTAHSKSGDLLVRDCLYSGRSGTRSRLRLGGAWSEHAK